MANAFDRPVAQILKGRFAQNATITWPATGGLSRDGTKAAPTTLAVRGIVGKRKENINGAIVQLTTVIVPATERSLIGATLTLAGGQPRKITASENVAGTGDDAAFQRVTLT